MFTCAQRSQRLPDSASILRDVHGSRWERFVDVFTSRVGSSYSVKIEYSFFQIDLIVQLNRSNIRLYPLKLRILIIEFCVLLL
jgi:hypothetical protein